MVMVDSLLDSLKDGCRVRAKFARRDNEEGDAPDWGPVKTVTLNVMRRDKAIKHRGVVHPVGELTSLTVKDFDWAEYDQRSYCEDGEFLAEEYRMKIVEVL
jgi:hypothetical protein